MLWKDVQLHDLGSESKSECTVFKDFLLDHLVPCLVECKENSIFISVRPS